MTRGHLFAVEGDASLHYQSQQNTTKMKNRAYLSHLMIFALITAAMPLMSQKYSVKNNLNFTLNGTSTLHDWEMTASNGTCTIDFITNATGDITGINSVAFNMPAKSLKSGKAPMDKNAYTALKADKYANITAKLKTGSVQSDGAGICTVKTTIALTMAGVTKDLPINVKIKKKGANAFEVTGERKITMTDFSMEPPTFMMGAVKTGNDVTVKFSLG